VVGVSNAMTLKAQAAPGNITLRIKDALTRQAEEEAKHIEVSVKGSRAILQGTVHSWAERSAAAGAVWAAPGIAEVVNELRVSG
jgi:osmotically-inducible protein OsmY